ncbi:MAG: vitamin B12-dependent ribonucleotide reductase [Candidatus Aenigmatarchaeota archaeon]
MPVTKVRKRDGRLEDFSIAKIATAIHKALMATKTPDAQSAQKLAEEVTAILNKRFERVIPSVENIQDIVEETLMRHHLTKAAKAYILYRQRRAEEREVKRAIGVPDELKLGINAIAVLERRYLLKNEEGKVIETPAQLFRRVARAIAQVDKHYGEDAKASEEAFYAMMASREFLPNTPTLMNAGTPLGQLSACFVLPIEDSLKSIFKAVADMATIQQSGGGTGFAFSRLRPKGDIVRSTKGVASGPISFMRIFDVATDTIKQGGKRRGANMGILRIDHPDIEEFITAKAREGFLANFNLSVAVTDKFMRAVAKDQEYELINPRTGHAVRKVRARDIWDLIITYAWRTGDPGIIFIDEVNRSNPTAHIGKIESTNPCGEQPLHPYESCNLGSINLAKMLRKITPREGSNNAPVGCEQPAEYEIWWEKLRSTVRNAVHFLDNVIDANKYPLPEIERITKANRRIGLGVMGFADMLLLLGVPYDSTAALKLGEKVMKFINEEAHKASATIAEKRGSFPNFKGSLWEKRGWKAMRNATCTTIAPTGTISIIAGCSSGIEPLFAVAFVRNVLEGTRLFEINPIFEQIAKARGFYSPELMQEIARTGSVRKVAKVPEDLRQLFVTALDIEPEWHVRMQAAFQRHTDNAVSKTINFRHDATAEEVRKAYELAHRLKCKGITVYRYGSKREQVLYIGELERKERPEAPPFVTAESEFAGGCPTPLCPAPA